jgi:hypothetical protein
MLSRTKYVLQPAPPCPPRQPLLAGAGAVTPHPAHFAPGWPTLASGCQDGLWVVLGAPRGKEPGARWPAGGIGRVADRWPLTTTQEASWGVAGLRYVQPMVKQPVQKAAVAARVAVALDEGHELIDFGGSEGFAVVPHFVQCLKRWTACNARNGVRGVPSHETFGRQMSTP